MHLFLPPSQGHLSNVAKISWQISRGALLYSLQSPECVTSIRQVNTIVLGDSMSEVREQRDLQTSKAALVPRSVEPGMKLEL